MASFKIDIKENQNRTWQGNIVWLDGKQEESFRSAIEMIKLIDSVMMSSENAPHFGDGSELKSVNE